MKLTVVFLFTVALLVCVWSAEGRRISDNQKNRLQGRTHHQRAAAHAGGKARRQGAAKIRQGRPSDWVETSGGTAGVSVGWGGSADPQGGSSGSEGGSSGSEGGSSGSEGGSTDSEGGSSGSEGGSSDSQGGSSGQEGEATEEPTTEPEDHSAAARKLRRRLRL